MRQLDMTTMENMTPIDYLHSTSKIYGVDKTNLDFVLGLVTPFFPVKTKKDENGNKVVILDPFKNAIIKDLSGGQRRMLVIAAALFQKTNLLLLDEPLSGLDSVSSQMVIDLLKFIAKENSVTIFMTMHQPSNEILGAMDQVVVLEKGKVLFDSKFDTMSDGKSAAFFIHELLKDTTDVELISKEKSKVLKAPRISTSKNRASIADANPTISEDNHFFPDGDDDPKLGISSLQQELNHIDEVYSKKLISKTQTTYDSEKEEVEDTMKQAIKRKLQQSQKSFESNNHNRKKATFNSLRLWQMQPLVRRINLEHGSNVRDILILPICFLVMAAWGRIDATNPLNGKL